MLVEFVIGALRDMLGKVHTAKLHTLQCSHRQSVMKEGNSFNVLSCNVFLDVPYTSPMFSTYKMCSLSVILHRKSKVHPLLLSGALFRKYVLKHVVPEVRPL